MSNPVFATTRSCFERFRAVFRAACCPAFRAICCVPLGAVLLGGSASAQQPAGTLGPKSIGQSSLVDRYRRSSRDTTPDSGLRETSAFQPAAYTRDAASVQRTVDRSVRQAVAMQGGPEAGRALPSPGGFSPPPSSSDLSQIAPPQLSGSGFATMNNCPNVVGPSSYTAASGIGCGQSYGYATPAGFTAGPQQIAAPAQMPAQMPGNNTTLTGQPLPQSATGAPASSLFTLGQSTFAVQVGQGLWGQPVAYVPGQRVRNWIRYMSP